MEYIGGTAGATLGYITNGRRGAKYGWRAGKHFAQQRTMVTPRTPRKKTAVIFAKTLRRDPVVTKKLNYGLVPYVKRPKVIHTPSASGYSGLGGNAAALSRKKRKDVTIKKKKRVKVTSLFKQKVRAALDDHVKGQYLKVTYARMPPITVTNTQNYFDFGTELSPLAYIDAADVLFNGKTPVQTPTLGTTNWTNNAIRTDVVINSYVSYELKNVSQRTYRVKMYVCAPKVNPTDPTPNDALADWASGAFVANTQGFNPQNNGPNTLFCDPRDYPQFNRFWKAEVTDLILEPGQSQLLNVQGGNNMTLDYSKLWGKNIAAGAQWVFQYAKFSRNVFFVYYPDLVTTDTAGCGRYVSAGTGVGGIICERKVFIKMACPESAGFKYPAAFVAGANQQLTNKLPCKVIANFPIAFAGVAQDIMEENPINVINPAP